MASEGEYFVRELDVDVLNTSLKLYQVFKGDVGCVVWDAAIVLGKYLEELYKKDATYFHNLSVVELGAGVGCPGLFAACFGAKVILTDLHEMVPLLAKNIAENSGEFKKNNGTAQTLALKWGESPPTDLLRPNLILLADCIYYKECIDKLITTLKNLSGPNTKILISQELRDTGHQQDYWNYFLETVQKYFLPRFVPLEHQNQEFRSQDIVLMELWPLKN
ncbi:protein N-lysine methyltransferase METTL21D-like [Anthonomus grandis grandis]|uniref:protein N-lysine methyltransferase METTL21D-like n=1 Tax=Anthonomus grandis grandis TaxID=2921223 RepID=UPI0021662961|nr:protein N-lysine methyltransferase METTL21D-like [Anthonomus grandis grandis]